MMFIDVTCMLFFPRDAAAEGAEFAVHSSIQHEVVLQLHGCASRPEERNACQVLRKHIPRRARGPRWVRRNKKNNLHFCKSDHDFVLT